MELVENSKIISSRNDESDIIDWFEKVSTDAKDFQRETLRDILELNWGSEYLRKWLGDGEMQEMDSQTLESMYISLVPLVSHSDLEPYIERISNGEKTPILTQHPITKLVCSSGTTAGRQKLFPFTNHFTQTTLQVLALTAAYRLRTYPIREGRKQLEFIYRGKESKSKGGLTVATATTHFYGSKEFKMKQEKYKSLICSPMDVIAGGDYKQSTYCHLLLGLFFRDEIEFVTSTFAYIMVEAFASFEGYWKEICNDIRQGTLSTRISIHSMRKAVLDILHPNPCLASRIEQVCGELETLNWVGVIPKLWPTAKYVYSIMTGSMQIYVKKLRHYSGSLPLVSIDYTSSEGWVGANVDPSLPPEQVTYAVVPTACYFEFIPLHSNDNGNAFIMKEVADLVHGQPVPLYQLKLGQEYEIVLTTFTGLYRYKLGDVVEVRGFHNNTPKLRFLYRRNVVLSISIDKTSEKDVQIVVEQGTDQIFTSENNAELIDFTSYADIESEPKHYTIYLEIKGAVDDEILANCCTKMDGLFCDPGYVRVRTNKSLGPLELRIVEVGTFKKILDMFLQNGATLSQFKTPRCTCNQNILAILNRHTIKRFLSKAYE